MVDKYQQPIDITGSKKAATKSKKKDSNVDSDDEDNVVARKKKKLESNEKELKQKFKNQIKRKVEPFVHYQCIKCKFLTVSKDKALFHTALTECPTTKKKKVKEVECNICEMKFSSTAENTKHFKDQHMEPTVV